MDDLELKNAIQNFCKCKRDHLAVDVETKDELTTLKRTKCELQELMQKTLENLQTEAIRFFPDGPDQPPAFLRIVNRRGQTTIQTQLVVDALNVVTSADIHDTIARAAKSRSRNRPVTVVDAIVETVLKKLSEARTKIVRAVSIEKKCPRDACLATIPVANEVCVNICKQFQEVDRTLKAHYASRKRAFSEIDAKYDADNASVKVHGFMEDSGAKSRRITLKTGGETQDFMLRRRDECLRKKAISVGHVREILRDQLTQTAPTSDNVAIDGTPNDVMNSKIRILLGRRNAIVSIVSKMIDEARCEPCAAKVVLQKLRSSR